MNNTETIINLTFDSNSVKHIYDDLTIKSKDIHKVRLINRLTIASVLIGLSILFYSIQSYSQDWIYFANSSLILALIIAIESIYKYQKMIKSLINWSTKIDEWILESSKVKKWTLKINEEIQIIGDGVASIIELKNVTHYIINAEYINLMNQNLPEENILLPKSSMTSNEFNSISELITNRLKALGKIK